MNYLEYHLKKPQGVSIKNFNSLESLIKSVTDINPIVPEPINEDKKIVKPTVPVKSNTVKSVLPVDLKPINEIKTEKANDILNESTLQEVASGLYKLYRDVDEIFECKVSVSGATLSNAIVRLVCEAESWNIVFYGKIYTDGRCVVPLKKMSIYTEGTIGKAKLEIILDDVLFTPWQEPFIVEGAKRVTVELIKKRPDITVDKS